jgi:hypothetical protein
MAETHASRPPANFMPDSPSAKGEWVIRTVRDKVTMESKIEASMVIPVEGVLEFARLRPVELTRQRRR